MQIYLNILFEVKGNLLSSFMFKHVVKGRCQKHQRGGGSLKSEVYGLKTISPRKFFAGTCTQLKNVQHFWLILDHFL